jgi:mRNA interferase MazF
MPYRRGDVIAVPYEYSDLTGGKVRPAVIISSDAYNLTRPDVVAAGISSRVTKAGPYDHILADWAAAGLRYPSLVRGRLLTIEQNLIRRTVGRLSQVDLAAFEEKLATFLLSDVAIADYLLTHVDLTTLSGQVVQAMAEKSARASLTLAARGNPAIDLVRLCTILAPEAGV